MCTHRCARAPRASSNGFINSPNNSLSSATQDTGSIAVTVASLGSLFNRDCCGAHHASDQTARGGPAAAAAQRASPKCCPSPSTISSSSLPSAFSCVTYTHTHFPYGRPFDIKKIPAWAPGCPARGATHPHMAGPYDEEHVACARARPRGGHGCGGPAAAHCCGAPRSPCLIIFSPGTNSKRCTSNQIKSNIMLIKSHTAELPARPPRGGSAGPPTESGTWATCVRAHERRA